MIFSVVVSRRGQVAKRRVGDLLVFAEMRGILRAAQQLGASAWAYEAGQTHPLYYVTPQRERLPPLDATW